MGPQGGCALAVAPSVRVPAPDVLTLRLEGIQDPRTFADAVHVDFFQLVTTPARLLASTLVTIGTRVELCQRPAVVERRGKTSIYRDGGSSRHIASPGLLGAFG